MSKSIVVDHVKVIAEMARKNLTGEITTLHDAVEDFRRMKNETNADNTVLKDPIGSFSFANKGEKPMNNTTRTRTTAKREKKYRNW